MAEIVRDQFGGHINIETAPTNDPRSYHVCGKKIFSDIGFVLKFSIRDAVRDLASALKAGKFENPMNNPLYYNIQQMQRIKLK